MPNDVVCALAPPRRAHELGSRLASRHVTVAASAAEIDSALRARPPDLLIVCTRLLDPPIERWVRQVRDLPESPDVVLLHDQENPRFRAAALQAGCLGVLGASLSIDELTDTVRALVRYRSEPARLAREISPAREDGLRELVSLSPVMQELLGLARKVADTGSSLLLLGETGSGKERLARAIHAEGRRAAGPFVAVNCGALPEHLAESELFGHEKGAFTGAIRRHRGYFEQAVGGTLLLDEIGDVPLHLQVKLLRVLEERRVQRVGAEALVPVDVRIVAASHRDLELEVREGRFRKDLFYRLAVVTLTIPPLRERREDIPALFEQHVERFGVALHRPIHGVEDAAMRAFVGYRWPGNVRELINVAERAVLLSRGPEIGLADLPEAISSPVAAPAVSAPPAGAQPGEPAPAWLGKSLQEARQEVVDEFELRYLRQLLTETGGRVGEAARRAGLHERSLYELMRRHRLRKEEFRVRRARRA